MGSENVDIISVYIQILYFKTKFSSLFAIKVAFAMFIFFQ